MLARCENPSDRRYADYGGRGITVWGPWHSLARFITDVEAEIGPRPSGRTPGGMAFWTLERKDNNQGYRPGNIEWADRITQRHNRRDPVRLTPTAVREIRARRATGETLTAIAADYGVSFHTVYDIAKRRRRAHVD
jgi:hypothetical protein